MLRKIGLISVLLMLSSSVMSMEKMPCEYVDASSLGNLNRGMEDDFLNCLSKNRVCGIVDNSIFSADLIKNLRNIGDATTLVIIQSTKNDLEALCLVGSYSGGSAAAWGFSGYKVKNGEITTLEGMDRAYAQGDAIPPKSAALMTFEMYQKYGEPLP